MKQLRESCAQDATALFALALRLLPEPQVFVDLALFIFATVAALLRGRKRAAEAESL